MGGEVRSLDGLAVVARATGLGQEIIDALLPRLVQQRTVRVGVAFLRRRRRHRRTRRF